MAFPRNSTRPYDKEDAMETPPSAPTSALPTPSILDPSHPLAYLAYLPQDVAYELTISVYMLVAALVVSRISLRQHRGN